MNTEALNHLCQLYGVESDYVDIWGNRHGVSEQTKRALLAAMGVQIKDAAALPAAVETRTRRGWQCRLPPVQVVRASAGPITIPLVVPVARAREALNWTFITEAGEQLTGTLRPSELTVVEQGDLDSASYARYAFTLPVAPILGYHRFLLRDRDAPYSEDRLSLIVTPDACFQPAALAREGRVWGWAVQLYALRSQRNWGIGDFTDLRRLVEASAPLGASLIGLNPLHALFLHNPTHASPYSPSSRLFLNILYLDVEAIPDFAECDGARAQVSAPAFQARLRALREADYVDYSAVAAIKLPVLEQVYHHFRTRHLTPVTPRGKAFRAFQAQAGEALRCHALYEALQEHFHRADPGIWGWPAWPPEYRAPDLPAVAEFAETHRARVEFFQYVQWQAFLQLAEAGDRAQLALGIGLYRDLAVGVDRAGAEAWANQKLYALAASVGCPPDDFNLNGQNWGLPPMVPDVLTQTAYAPFIATLRANMRAAGALRIDHVMGLLRLFWVPPGDSAGAGAYVRYPLMDLLGILALESQRHRCLIIGEDLGTVPDEIRVALSTLGVLSYRLFYFQRDSRGDFASPSDYAAQAAVAVTTHDLPTLAGFWHGQDLNERSMLNLYPSAQIREQEISRRAEDRGRLLRALERAGLLPAGITVNPASSPAMSPALIRAVHCYLGQAPSKVMLVQFEDVLGQLAPVNLPGTVDERPNWRQKLEVDLDDLFKDERVLRLGAVLRAARGRTESL